MVFHRNKLTIPVVDNFHEINLIILVWLVLVNRGISSDVESSGVWMGRYDKLGWWLILINGSVSSGVEGSQGVGTVEKSESHSHHQLKG